jgi:hypothetical protein
MDTLPEETRRARYLPVIGWMIDSDDPAFVPGPCIGGDREDAIPSEYVVEAFGVRLAFNLPDALLEKYQDCALDYLGGRFLFVDKDALAFVGRDPPD